LSDPSKAPRRHEWMPNRMFDPSTNPFAIQNLLKREKKEDATFLLKRDERPVFDYSDDSLLKESKIQPAADFQLNQLLDQSIIPSSGFQSGVGEQFPTEPVQKTCAAEANDISPINAELSEEINQPHAINSESDEAMSAAHTLESGPTEDHDREAIVDATENLAVSSHTDPIDVTKIADAKTEADAHDTLVDQDATVQEPMLGSSVHEVVDNFALQPDITTADATGYQHQKQNDSEHSVEQTFNITVPSDEVSSTEGELNAGLSQSEPEMGPSLNTEAVTQLIETAREEMRVEAHAAGFQEGLEVGLEQAKTEMQATVDEKLAVIDQMIKGLHQLERDPNALFEPMKKLAMHLAEQLVRGELTQSAQVVARLVDNCLRELAASGEKAVIIHLNPDDLEQYKPLTTQFGDSMVLRPDALLSRGSVRASLDGSVVEDLIDRRTKGLSKSLAQPVASSWRPALATPSAKPKQNVASKPVAPATPVTSAATIETHDSDYDEIDQHESDRDDDLIIDELSSNHIDDTQNDRNDETHS